MRLALHPGAIADLSSAGDWYERQLAGLGADLVDEVDRALEAIAERPSVWPLWPGSARSLASDDSSWLASRLPWAT